MKLDSYDKKILTLLQKNNKISQRNIAEKVCLSVSSVNRKITDLESAGVIQSNVAIVDPVKVDRPLIVVAKVKLVSEQRGLVVQNGKKLADCPQIQQIYYITGKFDFLVIMQVRDMDEYEKLTQELFFNDENIQTFKTSVVMKTYKNTSSVFID